MGNALYSKDYEFYYKRSQEIEVGSSLYIPQIDIIHYMIDICVSLKKGRLSELMHL